MTSKDAYLIITEDVTTEQIELGPSIRSTMVVCSSFRKAYDLALSMGEIADVNLGYKQALNRTTSELAVQLEDRISSNRVIIAKVKKY
jgi:hypothetical protein